MRDFVGNIFNSDRLGPGSTLLELKSLFFEDKFFSCKKRDNQIEIFVQKIYSLENLPVPL